MLEVVGPGAVDAAVRAEAEAANRRDEVRDALQRDPEAARYAAERAFRQYDASDPANRLVTAELEARWEAALGRQTEVEDKLAAHESAHESAREERSAPRPMSRRLPWMTMRCAQDLAPEFWMRSMRPKPEIRCYLSD